MHKYCSINVGKYIGIIGVFYYFYAAVIFTIPGVGEFFNLSSIPIVNGALVLFMYLVINNLSRGTIGIVDLVYIKGIILIFILKPLADGLTNVAVALLIQALTLIILIRLNIKKKDLVLGSSKYYWLGTVLLLFFIFPLFVAILYIGPANYIGFWRTDFRLIAGLIDANFFASLFFPSILIFYLNKSQANHYLIIILIAFVFLLTFSRGFLLGALTVVVACYLAETVKKTFIIKISFIALMMVLIFSPFIILWFHDVFPDIFSVLTSEYRYSSDVGRNVSIIIAVNHILDGKLILGGVMPEDIGIKKPHHWFWQLALTNGIITAMLFCLIFGHLFLKLPVVIGANLFGLIVFASFLDFAIITRILFMWSALILILGGFKYEPQHVLTKHETLRRGV